MPVFTPSFLATTKAPWQFAQRGCSKTRMTLAMATSAARQRASDKEQVSGSRAAALTHGRRGRETPAHGVSGFGNGAPAVWMPAVCGSEKSFRTAMKVISSFGICAMKDRLRRSTRSHDRYQCGFRFVP